MRSKRRKPNRQFCRPARRTPSLSLEQLDSRLLLNATTEWLDPIENSTDDVSGYGTPDLIFSDPSLWDHFDTRFVGPLSSGDYLNIMEQVEQEYLDQYYHDLAANASAAGTETPDDGISGDYGDAAESGGTYTLFLDFDGARVYSRSGDFWLGSDYVDIPAYDLSSFGWGGMEQQSIDMIVDFVREDYAAYNINITTEQPTGSDYTTLYVGGTNEWFRPGSGVIGVATYDVGNVDASNYGFAFSEELGVYTSYCDGDVGNFSEYLANLIAHEAAHTYGSNHVDDVTALMNPYLPISPRTSSFGSGIVPNTSEAHDTQQILGSNIGYAHGSDDYGDTAIDAETISLNSVVDGLLERRDDVDAFTFTAAVSGTMTVDIDTEEWGNLDSVLTVIRNSDSTVMGQNDDYNGQTDSLVSFTATEGVQYTIAVSSYSSNSSGTYALALTSESPVPVPIIDVTDSSGDDNDGVIDFGTVTVNTDTTAEITIANNGNDDLVISELIASGGFNLDTVCSASDPSDDLVISPSGEASVTVTFSPDDEGSYSGYVTIASNDSSQSVIVMTLAGEAIGPQPNIDLSAGSEDLNDGDWDFGTAVRGVPTSQMVSIVNTGSVDLDIDGIYVSDDFAITDGYDGTTFTLAPQQSRDITVELTGNQRGDLDGVLLVMSNDPDQSSLRVDISTQIVGGVLTVQDSSGSSSDGQIDFGDITLNDTGPQSITLTNSGDAALTLTGIESSGIFDLDTFLDTGDSGDDIVLGIGQSMTVNVMMTPEEMDNYSGAVTITTDDIENPVSQVQLTGTGVAGVLQITEADGVDDGELSGGAIVTGDANGINAWQVTNNGNKAITIHLSLATGTDYELAGDPTLLLAAGETQTVSVIVQTELAHTIGDTLMLWADDINSTSQSLNISADAYALVSQGQRYQFIDQSGDKVTISLNGDGVAKVTTGIGEQPDIVAIECIDTTASDKLKINVSGGGRTLLGEITGDGDLGSIMANKVDLVGDGIDLGGSLAKLQLGSVFADEVHFSAESGAMIRVGDVIGGSVFDIDGDVVKFQANNLIGSTIECDQMGRINIAEQFDSDLSVTNGDLDMIQVRSGDLAGDVHVSGNIFKVMLSKGDLTGSLTSDVDVYRVMMNKGTLEGTVAAGQSIGRINALNICDSTITAQRTIDQIAVKNEMLDSLVSIGPADQSESGKIGTLDSNSNDAWLGSLKVNGTFSGTTVAVGVAPDEEGNFLNGTSIAGSGTIERVDLRNVEMQNESDPFGLCARDSINRMTINRQRITSEFQQDDFYVAILND